MDEEGEEERPARCVSRGELERFWEYAFGVSSEFGLCPHLDVREKIKERENVQLVNLHPIIWIQKVYNTTDLSIPSVI